MSEIEFFDTESVATGAVGEPGARAFYLQARNSDAQLTVLVEKEQIALLAKEAGVFLDRLSEDYPEDSSAIPVERAELREPTVPLFRARLIGLGFDPDRGLVLIELREHASTDDDNDDDDPSGAEPEAAGEEAGYVARIYASRPQVRALIELGDTVVAAGRPPCPLCGMPMDPAGHRCPRWN
ncbi:MAG TPA: DUF3090 family protein [Acidimicrobiia bacterium]|nr:DUF3090 family protein [Acidimicrobiia bacterium]